MQKTLLIIDDDSVLRSNLALFFKEKGYEIIEAEDGEKGLEEIKLKKPTAILLDIMMPKSSGIDIIKEVKSIDSDLLPRIVLMTNSPSMQYVSDAIEQGVLKYIIKGDMSLDHIFKIVDEIGAN